MSTLNITICIPSRVKHNLNVCKLFRFSRFIFSFVLHSKMFLRTFLRFQLFCFEKRLRKRLSQILVLRRNFRSQKKTYKRCEQKAEFGVHPKLCSFTICTKNCSLKKIKKRVEMLRTKVSKHVCNEH